MLTVGSECYMETTRGTLMPAVLMSLSTDPATGEPLADVQAPGGKIYTCCRERLVNLREGRVALAERRAQGLQAQGYTVVRIDDETFCCRKPDGTGYLLRRSHTAYGEWTCSCPAHAKEGLCKHSLGLDALIVAQFGEQEARTEQPEWDGPFADDEPAPLADLEVVVRKAQFEYDREKDFGSARGGDMLRQLKAALDEAIRNLDAATLKLAA